MDTAIVLPPGRYMGSIQRQVRCEASTISETSYAPASAIPAHQHSRPYFMFLVRGRYTEMSRLGSRSLAPGQAFYHPPGFVHSGSISGTDTRILNLELSDDWIETHGGALNTLDKHVAGAPPQLTPLFARIYDELREPDAYTPMVVHGLSLEILAAAQRAPLSPSVPTWLVQARDFLHQTYPRSVTLRQVATEVSVHPTTLSRLFRRHFGCTVAEYVRRLRADEVCRLIRTSERPISEIALAAGFYDQSHFTRWMRKHTGYTPGALRRCHSSRSSFT